MANPTNFLTNKPPYSSSGQDLNTIFEPIIVNEIDYGDLTDTSPIGTTWTTIGSKITNTSNNVVLEGGGGRAFKINSAGLYRLNITLNFGENNGSTFQNVAYILSNDSDLKSTTVYDFTPSPNMSTISAINCSGACGITGNAVNYLNSQNIENCLSLNLTPTKLSEDPYFFAFRLTGTGTSNSNFFTLDITFKTFFNTGKDYQMIYPYIRCTGSGQTVTLQNSKWMFTRLN